MLVEKYREYYTVKDYQQWQGDWELIEGIPFAMAPSPFINHQLIISQLVYLLKKGMENTRNCKNCLVIPEIDWIVKYDTVLRPDVVITCSLNEFKSHLREKPEVVFEVVSPSTAKRDETLKYEIYMREKVPYYVIVYPELKKVRAFKLSKDGYELFFNDVKGILKLNSKECEIELKVEEIFKE